MANEVTLAGVVSYDGIGLHSGNPVHMTISPAEAGEGIVFTRTDMENAPSVPARADFVTATVRATTISRDGLKFFTIEHIMSALYASGIDNAMVALDAEEPPVVDGSAIEFCKLIAAAGKKELARDRNVTVIDKVYRAADESGEHFVIAIPYDGFRVSFTSLNSHPLIGVQYYDFDFESGDYAADIAPARTIAYEREVEGLRSMGLGLGGTLENVIVYNDEGWLNELRFPDELVRHKILDFVGDIYLAGRVRGHFVAVGSGHALNTALAKDIVKGKSV